MRFVLSEETGTAKPPHAPDQDTIAVQSTDIAPIYGIKITRTAPVAAVKN